MTDAKTEQAKADKAAEAKAVDTRSEARSERSESESRTTDTKVATYRVTAPYVTLKSRSDTGAQVLLGYYEGAIVPETVDLDDLARHVRKGMVERVEGADLKAVQAQKADAEKAEKTAEAPQDKEGAQAVADAEADRKAAEEAAAKEEAEAKKERRPLVRATDSPRSLKTAQTG